MNNIYNGHEFVLKLGRELKPQEEQCSYLECIACGLEIGLSIFCASDDIIRKAFSPHCKLKRK